MNPKWGFVSKQLESVESPPDISYAVVTILRTIEEECEDMRDDDKRLVMQYVQKLALGHSLTKDSPDEKWGPVIPGEYNVGDTVRVKSDAYAAHFGIRHNGKRGRVTAVHQGKTVVLYDDARNSEESYYHDPSKLERLL